ncbi:MAG: radical SAM protein, partial [Candidatus Gracilibacteria bacterium]|nr:radical SAM protein [Candidatus Gracilibacteria bacterium]
MKKFRFSAVNLGCNKNMVDLEFVIGEILKLSNTYKIEYYEEPEDSSVEYVIINTCGFLSTSRKEAEQTIKYYDGLGKKLIIIGCYLEVKDDDFLSKIKEYQTINFKDFPEISSIIFNKEKKDLKDKIQKSKKAFIWKGDETRAYFNAPFGYEYLKIAEGCDNKCTFCIIPQIRGSQTSRQMEDILNEVKLMIENGISEIIIIAQDTTRYGTDLYKEPKLMELLEKIENLKGDFKFRLLYMYPDNLTLSNIEKLKKLKKIIPYFDIPFQHISENILKKMARFYDKQ